MDGLDGRPGWQIAGGGPRRLVHKYLIFAVAAVASLIGLTTWPSAAFATVVTEPASNPFTVPLDIKGNALPFTVASGGWPYHQLVYIEICDGLPATARGWSPAQDCDNQTSPSAAAANANGDVNFPAGSRNYAIRDVHGASPNGQFNCLAPSEIPADATRMPDGSWMLSANDTRTAAGIALNTSTPAWNGCQLRISSNNAYATADQQFIRLSIPGPPLIPGQEKGGSSASSTSASTKSNVGPSASSGSSGSASASGNSLSPSGPSSVSATGSRGGGPNDPGYSNLAKTGADPVRLTIIGAGLIGFGSVLVARTRQRAGYIRPNKRKTKVVWR